MKKSITSDIIKAKKTLELSPWGWWLFFISGGIMSEDEKYIKVLVEYIERHGIKALMKIVLDAINQSSGKL